MESDPTYRAFISYSHSDSAVAAWLHKALETYRLPAGLGGSATAGRALGAVFRDRTELSAGSNLSQAIREALDRSEYLVVVCSAASRGSHWVGAEVGHFLQTRDLRHVLCVIVDAPPGETSVMACLPPALAQAYGASGEPLAADLRPDGDGRRLARLKIAAGLLGVGLDRLIQRDARRRLRWMAVATTAAAIVSLCMAGLAWTAIDARRLAQARNAEAEDLVAYMLGDLHDKLEPVGRLDVLDGVGRKVLDHYAKIGVRRLDDAALAKQSKALTLIGSIRNERGDLAGARVAFAQAAATSRALSARNPKDTSRLFDEAQNVYWLAYVDWRQGQGGAAEAGFKEYSRLAETLVRLEPANPAWRLETAYARSNLGTVFLEQGRLDEALTAFEGARATFKTASLNEPEDGDRLFDLVDAQNWVADVLVKLGRLKQSYQERHDAAAMLHQHRRADPSNMPLAAQTFAADLALARRAADLGQQDEARELVTRARGELAGLVQRDSDNTTWVEYAAVADLNLADLALDDGDLALAKRAHGEARARITRLTALNPTVYRWRWNLEGELQRQAISLALMAGDATSARDQARRLAEASTAKTDSHSREEERIMLAGFAYLALDDPGAAVKILSQREKTLTPQGRDLLARALVRTGDLPRARKILNELRGQGYARLGRLAI
jgi:tetratricopeptide (TPR) repeat protein